MRFSPLHDFNLLLNVLQDCSGASQEELSEWFAVDVSTINRHMNNHGRWRKTKAFRMQWVSAFEKCRKTFANNSELCCRKICTTLQDEYFVDSTPYRTIFEQNVYDEQKGYDDAYDAFVNALVSAAWDGNLRAGERNKQTNILTKSIQKSDSRIVSFQDLLKIGMTPIDIANRLVENDIKLYRTVFQNRGITEQNEGSVIQWAEYLCSYPMSFQYLVNANNEIIGNFSFVSITEEMLELYIKGLIFEENFTPSMTLDLFSSGSDHILFLLNLSVNDEYSTAANNLLLRRAFLMQILSFAENDAIFFKKIVTNVYKSSQESFYKQWGFSFIKPNTLSGNIYELNMTPYPKVLYERLKSNEKYSEICERLKESYEREYML